MSVEPPPDPLAAAEGQGAQADGADAAAPQPEPRMPYARAHAPGSAPSRRRGTIPGAASAPPATAPEEAYKNPIPGPAPLPRVPGVDHLATGEGGEGDGPAAARRRSRRLVKVTEELTPVAEIPVAIAGSTPGAPGRAPPGAPSSPGSATADGAALASPLTSPATISAPPPVVSDDDWLSPESARAVPAPPAAAVEPASTPEAPPAVGPSAPPARLDAADAPAPLPVDSRPSPSLPRASVPRPVPRPVSARRPSIPIAEPSPLATPAPPAASAPSAPPPLLPTPVAPSAPPASDVATPAHFIADPDAVAVIRPIQIIAVESDLPAVASTAEAPPSDVAPSDGDEVPALPLRFVSDGPTPLDAAAELASEELDPESAPEETRPTVPRWQGDADVTPPGAPDASGWAGAAAFSSAPPVPPPPPPLEARPAIDEIEPESLEEVEPEPRSGELEPEPIEVEPERDSDSGEEIPVDMIDEPEAQPKKPPPPPPRRPALASPDLAPHTSPTPPPAAAAAPAEAPAKAPARAPAEPAGPVSEAVRRKKPWWEELFGDDFIRTLDRLEPKVVRHEVDFIDERLGVEKGAVILDLACGAGAHAVEMASRGYSVVGYDLSLAMLALAADEAQDRGQKLNFLQGDMRDMAFEETFDAVYCWSTSFGYFDEDKNADVLHRIRRALRAGGMLLLDVINRDYVACRQPSLVWFEGEGCVCMDEMAVDFFTSRLKVKRTVMFEDGRSRELDYSIRLYGLHELGKLLHDAGFKVTEVTGHPAHPGVFFGSESPRLIILAERS